jgi:Type I phosphodiesterase / nucleotide pyrophosphatase
VFDKRVLLLEFNELSPLLTHRFIAAGQLPTFKRLYDQSLVYTTRARERAPYLDPWIQWVTVHTGLNYDQHRIDKLNEGQTCDAKRIWDVVSEQGGTSWICGSMSTSHRPGFKGALLPDPWTTKVAPTPTQFGPYFKFVQNSVLDSTNARAAMSRRDALGFVRLMLGHGLSARTAAAIVKQIAAERRGRHRWKRAVILDQLQFDLFRHRWQRERPTFSTLFLNSTAHFQHLHWREMEPELFRVQPTAADIEEYRSAILFGYQKMDAILARVLKMADDRTTVVLATALSQQPCLTYEDLGGKAFYRPVDFGRLLAFAGVRGHTHVAPVMAHQFHVGFESERAARSGQQRLLALRVDGRQAMNVEQNGSQIFAWCGITRVVGPSARVERDGGEEDRSQSFSSIFYKVDGIKSGMHHPDGLLWMRRPTAEHRLFEEPVELDLVAPTLLAELGIAAPPSMRQAVVPGLMSPRMPRAAAG